MTSESFLVVAVPALLAYLIGGLPFGYLFVRFSLGKDVRTMGSGNIGATNVHRTAGRKAGIVVLLLDIFKGWFAVWLAAIASHGNAMTIAFAIVGVMLGHCYPVFLRFKGGKAVACFVGAFLFVAPQALLATAMVFFLAVGASKFISLGSIAGALAFPPLLWAIHHPPESILFASIFASVLMIYRHRGNIERLWMGTENAFSLKGGSAR
ncbi:MAG: glycerol-3-phosphate 1-O-acyltransferase PlsY [Acidobacteriota bacterium]|nr:glycerol-3-phosphate 1-O-acyltransferase PlsY [Acidobacteriota bacterium]